MPKFKITVNRNYVATATAEFEVEAKSEDDLIRRFDSGELDYLVSDNMSSMKTDLVDADEIEGINLI